METNLFKDFIFNKCEKTITFDAIEIYFPQTGKAGRLKRSFFFKPTIKI